MFEISYHIFREVNLNRFASLTYYLADKKEDFRLYTEKEMIVEFEDKYYMYKGLKSFTASEKQDSFILVCKGKKTIFKINQ